MPPPPPPSRPPPPPPRTRASKSVTFCERCDRDPGPDSDEERDIRYYSDPGREVKPRKKAERKEEKSEDGYYSEPDGKYFEIDYQFLKELRKIAKHNCPKCKKRKRAEKVKTVKDIHVLCNGRYHSDREHCQLCCKVCNRSTETLDSIDDSSISRSYSVPSKKALKVSTQRKNSIQSIKSVSFLGSSNDSGQDEPNYTATSFTNDLKKFLLKPAAPRLSLRDKFITSIKLEFEATKKSPKLKAIKGMWKSY